MIIASKSAFLKKFFRYLLVGVSCITLLYFFQVQPIPLFAAACTYGAAQPATSINSPLNNQVFAMGTTNVTVSWNPINIDGETYNITTTNTTTNTVMPAQTITNFAGNLIGNTRLDIPVQNGNSYRVLIVPQNSCGGASSSEVNFSVATGQSSSTGPLNCYVTQSTVSQGPNYTDVQLTATPSSPYSEPVNQFNWDYYNDGSIDKSGNPIQQRLYGDIDLTLRIADSANRQGSCTYHVTLPPNSGNNNGTQPTCNLSANPQSGQAPLYVNLSSYNVQAPSGRSISSYSWDLDGNGSFGDNGITSSSAPYTYNYSTTPSLRVTDSAGASNTCSTSITITNQGGGYCLQVITPARNSYTGECRDFPNSCIPAGWTPVSSCTTSGGTFQGCTRDNYGPNPGSSQWCACAAQNGDTGSLMNYSCPQAPRNPSTGGQAQSCNDLGVYRADVCGGTLRVYNNCQASCSGGHRIYICTAPENSQCTTGPAGIGCSAEDNQCGGGITNGGNLPLGNIQDTIVNVANANANANINFNDAFSAAFSNATGGYSYAGGGGAGSSTVNISW